MSHNIRFIKQAEKDKLIEYISQVWKSDHIFCTSPSFLQWQHQDPEDSTTLNFIGAFCENNDQLEGILGFIPTKRFDTTLDDGDVGLAIWKASDEQPGLGLKLFMFLKQKLKPRSIYAIGLSEQVLPIYNALNFSVGILDHWVLINRSLTSYKLLQTNKLPPDTDSLKSNTHFIKMWTEQDLMSNSQWINSRGEKTIPAKSTNYLLNKYLHHPVYTYQFIALHNNDHSNDPAGLLISRVVSAPDNAKVLRGIDFIGDQQALINCAGHLMEVLVENKYEYFDLYTCNLNLKPEKSSLYLNKSEHPNLVVPNYFEPYMPINVNLDFAYWTKDKEKSNSFNLFKGDTDQDRPNLI